MGEAGVGKRGNFLIYFVPYILTAAGTMLLSELIATCTRCKTAQNNSSHGIPFWNLNMMIMGESLVLLCVTAVNNEKNSGVSEDLVSVINTLQLTFLMLSNTKVRQSLS